MPDDVLTSEIIALLAAPFPLASIEIKPGATTQAKDKCLCLAYADSRAYMERLDAVVGPSNWSARYEMLSPTIIQCAVTICGVTKHDVGDLPANDPNAATVASAQAFKRACSNFGLGRYLYSLPQKWADYDVQKRKVVNSQRVAQELYRLAGYSTEDQVIDVVPHSVPGGTVVHAPAPERPRRALSQRPHPGELERARPS